VLQCEDCGNDDIDKMCMGICAECGGEIVDIVDDGEATDGKACARIFVRWLF